jgi:hypothetical protein
MNFLKSIFHIVTIFGACLAAMQLADTMTVSENVMQQASGAAIALCYVVIPYCLARAVEQLAGR